MLLTILFYLFIVIVSIQLLFWVFLYGKFAFAHTDKNKKQNNFPVSVLIAARNEAKNLQLLLPELLSQKYQSFEVIIINDASTDATQQIIKGFEKHHKNLKSIHIKASGSYSRNKKNAITKGIEIASYDHLVFTDADCRPASPNWISKMASQLNEDKKIVLGYGAYKKLPTFLNKLIRYETILAAVQYFSYAKAGIPYMGVGRNLSYKKELFNEAKGFESHSDIKSGDDDLFISQIATKENTAICFSKDSFTISEPKKSFKSWFRQKRRHISTATRYKPVHQLLLGLFYFSQLSFWLLAIILLLFSFNWQLVTILVAIRLTFQYIAIYNSALKLNEKDLIIFSPILDLMLVFSQLGLFFSNLIQKPKHW